MKSVENFNDGECRWDGVAEDSNSTNLLNSELIKSGDQLIAGYTTMARTMERNCAGLDAAQLLMALRLLAYPRCNLIIQ